MAKRRPAWALGCGIGCGVLVLMVGALGFGGFLYMRGLVGAFKEADGAAARLESVFGEARRFIPEPGGAIPQERVEAFLDVRRIMEPVRSDLESSLRYLSEGEEAGWGPGRILGTARHGFGLIGKLAEFFGARNEAMLQAGMGPGEYGYIYAVAYYSWLERSPEDGPPFILQGDGDEEQDLPRERVLEIRRSRMRGRVHDTLLPVLRNQLSAAGNAPEGEVSGDWIESLKGEIALMEERSLRIPWEDGVPEVIAASLEPFRQDLEESYRPLSNPLEAPGRGHDP